MSKQKDTGSNDLGWQTDFRAVEGNTLRPVGRQDATNRELKEPRHHDVL